MLALTWLDAARGLEVSVVPGVMINTTNEATDYRTGTEFHVDGMLNVYLSTQFAVGLHGYYYTQIEGDDTRDPVTQGLRSTSAALGPAFMVVPPGGKGKIVGKGLHELDGRNRFVGDIVSLTIALPF